MHNEFMGAPYSGKGNILEFLQACEKSGKRPIPWQDEGLSQYFNNHIEFGKRHDLVTGFNNVADYVDWFSEEELRNVFDATGFFLARYSVDEDDALLGKKQSVFNPDKAVITAFQRCNQSSIMGSLAQIDHNPIKRFMKNTDIVCDMPRL